MIFNIPGHHGGEDRAGDLQHGVDVEIDESLALGGAVLYLQEVLGVVIAHAHIVDQQPDGEALVSRGSYFTELIIMYPPTCVSASILC